MMQMNVATPSSELGRSQANMFPIAETGKNLPQSDIRTDDAIRAVSGRREAECRLRVSASISYNKVLAKLASDHRKPKGQYVIFPEMGPAFIEDQPVAKFHGIGPATRLRSTRSASRRA